MCDTYVRCTQKDLYRREGKVVAAVWGKGFIKFLATLAILNQDDLNN